MTNPFGYDVFPAHAGMNRIAKIPHDAAHRVPRTRGDEPD